MFTRWKHEMLYRHIGVVGIALTMATTPVAAQQRPSPQEAEALLRANPDLAAQVRSRLRDSGLTPEQVRARLRAEGYPDNLLDSYLDPRAAGTTDSVPSPTVVAALRALTVDPIDDSLATNGATRLRGTRLTSEINRAIRCDTTMTPAAAKPDSSLLDARRVDPRPFDVTCRSWDGRPVAPPDSGRTIFGLDLFAGSTSQFDPNLAGPVDGSYKLGPGDQLVLLLTGEVELAHRLDVTREGFVFIPQVGQLHVANLTVDQLESVLYGALGRVYPGVRRGANATTKFSVNVARLRSHQVIVAGDVARPGSYRVSSAATALTALYSAGGPTPNGSLRRVEIRRGGKTVDALDVYDYLLRGDASHDPRLESGDVVFVPIRGASVRIVGEINRPATYELRPGETLTDLVRAAGGYRPSAVVSRVQVERILPAPERRDGGAARIVLDVSAYGRANAGGDGGGPADTVQVSLEDGDLVRVFAVPDRVRNRIVVSGNVWQPGSQGFAPGLRLSDALARAGGLRADAYLGHVLVMRTKPDSTRVQLRAALRDDGTAVDDIQLAPDDEVRVFSVSELRPNRQVAITGAVKRAGRVSYRDGMTLRDLILLAGGLDESARLGEVEIARLPENRAAGVTAQTIRVRIDSSYVFPSVGSTQRSNEIVLQPDDQVLVLRQPDWLAPRSVVLSGEVRYPGRYTLERRDERLSALIQRAGGLTPSADSSGIAFLRSKDGVGRIGVDLPRALRDGRSVDNLVLQDSDSIHIPPYSGIVTVAGAVNAPMAVAYVRGANIDYYVRAAGGPNRAGDRSRAYVTQASGRVETVRRRHLLPDDVPTPRAGSKVTVPERPASDGSIWSRNLPVVASIIGSLVTLAAVLSR
jgi:protein involved in polysaccharide export with SLBB domain